MTSSAITSTAPSTLSDMGSENRASFLSYMSELSVSAASSASSASLAAASSLSQTATVSDFTSSVTATNRTDSKTSTTADASLTANQSGAPNSASPAATEMAVHTDLSTAAKAGIGVGISIAAVLLIGALILYIKSRNNRVQARPRWLWQKETAEKEGKACLGPYQDETWAAGQNPDRMTEQEAMGIAELSSDSCTHELDGRSHMTPELDGEGRERWCERVLLRQDGKLVW